MIIEKSIELTWIASQYLDKHGPLTLKKCNTEKGEGSNDAIIVHGMLSTGMDLENFGNALVNRNCHRNVWLLTVGKNRHYYGPQIFSESTAQIVAESLMKNVQTGRLQLPLDLIGHSNGGYVVSHLTYLLPASYLRHIVTLGTPSGLYKTEIEWDNIQSCSHFVGLQDRVVLNAPIVTKNPGAKPTTTRTYFKFPDECHTSIHEDANSNGVADIISFICGTNSRHVFASQSGGSYLLHIWPWCQHEYKGDKLFLRKDIHDRSFTICDGLHQDYNSKHFKRSKSLIPTVALLENILNYWRISKRLNAILEETKEQLSMARWETKILKEDIATINRDIRIIQKISDELLRKTAGRDKKIIASLRSKKDFVISLLTEADKKCGSASTLGASELRDIIELLKSADKYYGSFINEVKLRSNSINPVANNLLESRK